LHLFTDIGSSAPEPQLIPTVINGTSVIVGGVGTAVNETVAIPVSVIKDIIGILG
jgi:hypothetical protein